ncbi:MAG: ATP-binding protein [Ignavibacteriae bacterium]|nr:ATP-binding protein [Ignavibacteriota bacterium]
MRRKRNIEFHNERRRIGSIVSLFFVALVASFLFTNQVSAQSNYKFDHLGMEDGLSESIVLCVLQDKEGFMWFGTADGLNRYDGYSFTVFKNTPSDSSSLINNYVTALFEDRAGNLWVSTITGLDWFDRTHERFVHYNGSLSENKTNVPVSSPTAVVQDARTNELWVGTASGELYQFLARQENPASPPRMKILNRYVHSPTDANGLHGSYLTNLTFDTDGNLWIGTRDDGINMFDKRTGAFRHFKHIPSDPHSLSHNFIQKILCDDEGRMWFGTEGGGVNRFDATSDHFVRYMNNSRDAHSLSHNVVRPVYQDKRGTLWIGTDGGGLNVYDKQNDSFVHLLHDNLNPSSPASNRILSIIEDRAGTLWFGTWGKGVDRFSPSKQKFKQTETMNLVMSKLPTKFIISLFEDSRGRLWFGTHGAGVLMFEPQTKTTELFTYEPLNKNSLPNNTAWSVREDGNGVLWFATDDGVGSYNPDTKQFGRIGVNLSSTYSLSSKYAGSIYPEQSGNIVWVTTDKALEKIDVQNGTVKSFPYSLGSPEWVNGFITAGYNDSNGVLWLGTSPLLAFDTKTEKYISHKKNIGKRPVSFIAEDSKQRMWLGTFNDGVFLFPNDGSEPKHFTEKEGLPNNVCYGMLEDVDGYFWLSTNRGISRLNLATLQFRNYDVNDGLQSNEFNRNAFLKGKDGRLYFGGVNGYNEFLPGEIKDNEYVPPVILTAFRKFNEPVNFETPIRFMKELTLSYQENFFSFEFAALDFTEQSKNRYNYMLEGFDEHWVDAGTQRMANYTNVDPGEYVFRVRGSNNDGVWNEEGASIRIIIPPPFWKTSWFIGLVIVLTAGAFGGTVRFISTQKLKRTIARLEQEKAIQEERQKTRERIARDLHDDLASTVGSAGFFIESVKRQLPEAPHQAKEFLNRTSSLLNEAEQAMSDIVWSVSPQHDTLESLILRIRLLTTELCKANNIKYEITLDGKSIQVSLPDEVRRNIYLVFKEAITNAVRYSEATLIRIHGVMESGVLELIVADDGKGFSETVRGDESNRRTMSGNGLRNMRKRSEEIGAEFSIVSEEGKGTTVRLVTRITQTSH